VATSGGVCRLKGPYCRRLTASLGLCSELTDVQKVFVASDGRIVLGSRQSGITLIDPKTNTARTIRHDNDVNHWINAIAEDSAGRLWFSDRGLGVLCLEGESLRLFNHKNSPAWLPDTDFYGPLCVGTDDSLWIGTESGLNRVCPDGTVQHFSAADVLPGNFIWNLSTDRFGAVWVVTDQGVAVYQHGWKYPKLPAEMFRGGGCVADDPSGGYWFGGFKTMHIANLQMVTGNPRETRLANFKRAIEQRYPKVPEKREGSTTFAAADSTGQIIGYESNRLLSFDGEKWDDLTALLHGTEAWNMLADKRGRVWVCTGGEGLIGIQGKRIERFNNQPSSSIGCVYNVAEASNGDLYIGTQRGLWRLRGQICEDLSTPQNEYMQATQLVVDANDRVWILDPNVGLIVYQEPLFLKMRHAVRSLWDKRVTNLAMTTDGHVEVEVTSHSGGQEVSETYRWGRDTPVEAPELVGK
jgi:ligand-binding sensor domain-containing protein